jgi:hypothetical protein
MTTTKDINWTKVLNSLKTTSRWVMPKNGRTKARLVLPDENDPRHFYEEVKNSYMGNVRSKYMVFALLFEGENVTPEMSTTVTPLVVPKTVLKGIISLLAEGYDLFGPDGHGITVTRTGKGLNTSYSVLPSRKPVDLPEDMAWPEESIEELADDFTETSMRRDEERIQEDEQQDKPDMPFSEDF